MKRILQILLSTILLSFFVVACTKSTDKFTPYATAEWNSTSWSNTGVSEAKAKQIIDILAKPNFTSSFNVVNGALIDVNSNLQVSLPGSSYLLNGNNYASGNVQVLLKQLLLKGDFIRNLIPSSSSSFLQETKGSFLIELSDNSKNSLSLAPNSLYSLRLIDSPTSQEYKYYLGNSSAFSEGGMQWNLADSISGGYLQLSNVMVQGVYKSVYEVVSKKLAWINIAKPIAVINAVDASVVLPQNFTNKTTFVFAVFADKNIVLQLSSDYSNKVFLGKNFPLGSYIKLISISLIDGQFYLGKQDIVVTNTSQYSLKPSTIPISTNDLSFFLDGL
jgi:hypothetical protein